MCPYGLREISPDLAPSVLLGLGAHHTHVVRSSSPEPGVRPLEPTLGLAIKRGVVWIDPTTRELSLQLSGDLVIREWSDRTVVV